MSACPFLHQPFQARCANLRGFFMPVMVTIAMVSLSGCDNMTELKQRILHPASTTASSTSSASTASAQAPTLANQPPSNFQTQSNQPVAYPFQTWQQQPASRIKFGDMQALRAYLTQQLKTEATLDEQSLDFYSDAATRYQFAKPARPHFDVVDSPTFLEFNWYYPSSADQANEKNMGVQYAQQVYQLSRGWLGEKHGTTLMEQMLMGQPIENTSYPNPIHKKGKAMHVMLARCETFNCLLVLKK